MKLAIVVRRYDRQGGISKGVAETAERFAKMGHEVHIFTNEWKDVKERRVIFHKVPMLKLPLFEKTRWYKLSRLTEGISFLFTSRLYCHYEDFDVVHVKGDSLARFDLYSAHSCHRAWLDLAKREVKTPWDWIRRNLNPHHLRILLTERYNLRRKNYIKLFAVSEGVRREIIRYYDVPEEDIVVIPNGIDLDEFNPKNKELFREEIRRRYNIPEDTILLIFVGYYFERKGLRYAIEALSRLKDENVGLLILGGDNRGPYLGLAEKIGVLDRVIFAGHQPAPQRFYGASDIFVFPTSYEAFPHALLEAAATGLPILATKVNGVEDLLREGVNGFYIEQNGEMIAKRVKELVHNAELRLRLGREARLSAEEYSWDRITREILRLYEEVRRGRWERSLSRVEQVSLDRTS
jgi:UDP-glucose:(heptosyl)LPS alpha-1,3-glucosyltransferase